MKISLASMFLLIVFSAVACRGGLYLSEIYEIGDNDTRCSVAAVFAVGVFVMPFTVLSIGDGIIGRYRITSRVMKSAVVATGLLLAYGCGIISSLFLYRMAI
ncbi:MAG TPA: hypothetical protein DDW52_27870 [Planctomycetaceae bacterium]|nr:hypothetical protein [Planctomycetaceae bacterium]